MFDRVGPTDFVGGALLTGYRLAFDKPNLKDKKEGFANLTVDDDGEVFGAVFELTKKQLDLLDGFYGGYKQIDVALRIIVDGEPGPRTSAVTWVAHRTATDLAPSDRAIRMARQAVEENDGPERFLQTLPPPPPEAGSDAVASE